MMAFTRRLTMSESSSLFAFVRGCVHAGAQGLAQACVIRRACGRAGACEFMRVLRKCDSGAAAALRLRSHAQRGAAALLGRTVPVALFCRAEPPAWGALRRVRLAAKYYVVPEVNIAHLGATLPGGCAACAAKRQRAVPRHEGFRASRGDRAQDSGSREPSHPHFLAVSTVLLFVRRSNAYV